MRQRHLNVVAKLVVLALLIISLGWGGYGWYALRAVDQTVADWDRQNHELRDLYVVLSDTYGALGYGGLIHNFKNYLLLRDEQYATKFEQDVNAASGALEQYIQFDLTEQELTALDTLALTITQYQDMFNAIASDRRLGMAIEDIDHQVSIDDSGALQALRVLEQMAQRRARLANQNASNAMADAIHLSERSWLWIPGPIQ